MLTHSKIKELQAILSYNTALIITGVRPEEERALASERASQSAVNTVIHLIFARCSAILVCGPLGK